MKNNEIWRLAVALVLALALIPQVPSVLTEEPLQVNDDSQELHISHTAIGAEPGDLALEILTPFPVVLPAGEDLQVSLRAGAGEGSLNYAILGTSDATVTKYDEGSLARELITTITIDDAVLSEKEFALRTDQIVNGSAQFEAIERFFTSIAADGTVTILDEPGLDYAGRGTTIGGDDEAPMLPHEIVQLQPVSHGKTFETCYRFNKNADGGSISYVDGRFGKITIIEVQGSTEYTHLSNSDLGGDGCISHYFIPQDWNGDNSIQIRWVIEYDSPKLEATYGGSTGTPGKVYWGPITTSYGGTYATTSVIPSGAAASLARGFNYAQNAYEYVTSYAGTPSSWLNDVEVHTEASSNYCLGGPACYHDVGDQIYLPDGAELDPYTVAHEYGHAVQDAMYYPVLEADYHYRCSDSSYSLAWQEGHANFIGDRTIDLISSTYNPGSSQAKGENVCSGSTSQQTEGVVERILYDIVDGVNEGWDTVDKPESYIMDVLEACYGGWTTGANHDSIRDFYSGSRGSNCDYLGEGKDKCSFLQSAYNNGVDFRSGTPWATVTSQSSFSWVGSTVLVTANAGQAECPIDVKFALDDSYTCSSPFTTWTDYTPSWAVSLATTGVSSGTYIYSCAKPVTMVTEGSYDRSSSYVRVDHTAPTASVSSPSRLSGPGYFTVSYSGSDSHSGVSCVRVEVRTTGSWSPVYTCAGSSGSFSYYGSSGTTYQFRARATDAVGNTGSYSSISSTYVNRPPIANAGSDQTVLYAVNLAQGVTVDAGNSYDPDGWINHYCFNWGDGSATQCGSASSRTHTYDEPTGVGGTSYYTVTVTVRDNDYRSASDTARIYVPIA